MDSLRKPLLLLAIFLIVLVVLVELGSTLLVVPIPGQVSQLLPQDAQTSDLLKSIDLSKASDHSRPPGLGIPYMALVDGITLFSAILIGSSLIIAPSAQAKVQGWVTAIFSILLILAAIAMIVVAIGLLLLMITLLISVPFGTIVYLVIYGFFNRGSASAVLSLLMLLKIGFCVLLVMANQNFLQNKGLVLIVLTSLLANVVVSLLQGLVPSFLVSITDAVAAIVVAVLAVVWAIFLLLGSLGSISKSIKPAT